jgi:hypothetical protein
MVGFDWTIRLTGRMDMTGTFFVSQADYMGTEARIVQIERLRRDHQGRCTIPSASGQFG